MHGSGTGSTVVLSRQGTWLLEKQHASKRAERQGEILLFPWVPRQGLQFTYSEGGGLVLAHTTDLRRPFLCQPCPALQLLSASEIPRERRIIVGLRPLNLSRELERRMEQARLASTVLCFNNGTRWQPRCPEGSSFLGCCLRWPSVPAEWH